MRVLLHPHIGLKRIRGDSNYLLFMDIAEYLIQRGNFVHMIVPEYGRDLVEQDRRKGLMYHFVEPSYDYYTDFGVYDPAMLIDLFARKTGKFAIDAVITSKPSLVSVYRTILSDPLRCRDMACYLIEPAVSPEGINLIKGQALMLQTTLGYTLAKTVYLTQSEKDIALRTARRWLSSQLIRQLDENGLVLSVGVPTRMIDDVTAGTEKYDKFTLFFGARMNSVKQPWRVFDLYSHLHAQIPDSQVVMTTNTSETKFSTDGMNKQALEGKRSAFDIQFACPRDEYLKKAAKSHVAIAWSTDEAFPVGFWEQMYLGVPVLWTDKPWVRGQLPDWYPFVFKDKYEAYGMVQYIRENYEKVQEEVMKPMRELILEQYDESIIYEQLEAEMHKDLTQKISYNMAKSVKKMMLECASLFGDTPFTLGQLIDAMSQVGTAFAYDQSVRAANAKFPTNYDVYRSMLDSGYRDTNTAARSMFQRVPDWDGTTSYL